MDNEANFIQRHVNQGQLMEFKNHVNHSLSDFDHKTKSQIYKFESRFENIDAQFSRAAAGRHKILEAIKLQKAEHQFLVDCFTRIENKVDTQIGGLQKDVSSLKTEVSTLKTDVSRLKTDVSSLKTDVSSLKTDVSSLKIDVSSLKKDIAQLTQMVQLILEKL